MGSRNIRRFLEPGVENIIPNRWFKSGARNPEYYTAPKTYWVDLR
jgi:hypothetical protein